MLLLLAVLGCGVGSLPVWRSDALTLDEHASFWIAGRENPGTLLQRSLDHSATPPLAFVLQRVALDVGGKHAWALRLPSLLALCVAPLMVFLAGRRMFGVSAGALAALLMAWHPDLWEPGRFARTYGITVALSSAALLLTVRWRERPTSWPRMLAWTLAQAALVWNHYVNLAFVSLLTLFAAAPFRLGSTDPVPYQRTVPALGLLVTLCAPLVPAFLRVWDLRTFLDFVRVAPSFWTQAGNLMLVMLPIGAGVVLFQRQTRQRTALPTAWMGLLLCLGPGLQLVFFLLSQTVAPTLGHQRYALAGAPASVLLLSAGLALAPRSVASGLAVGGLLAGWLLVGHPPWISPTIQSLEARDWKTLADVVQKEGSADEPLFVYGGLIEAGLLPVFGEDILFRDYIASRMGRFHISTPHPRLGLPLLPSQVPECLPIYDPLIAAAHDERQAIWLAAATDIDLGRECATGLRTLLQRRGWTVDFVQQETTARLERFRPPNDPP